MASLPFVSSKLNSFGESPDGQASLTASEYVGIKLILFSPARRAKHLVCHMLLVYD